MCHCQTVPALIPLTTSLFIAMYASTRHSLFLITVLVLWSMTTYTRASVAKCFNHLHRHKGLHTQVCTYTYLHIAACHKSTTFNVSRGQRCANRLTLCSVSWPHPQQWVGRTPCWVHTRSALQQQTPLGRTGWRPGQRGIWWGRGPEWGGGERQIKFRTTQSKQCQFWNRNCWR